MHLKTRTWAALSLLCFLAGAYLWHLGDERARKTSTAPSTNRILPPPAGETQHSPAPDAPTARSQPAAQADAASGSATNPVSPLEPLLAFRLSNTPKTLGDLMRSDRALLLRNALLDTSIPADLQIPEHLRSEGDPGSYVVQARGPLDAAFRDRLQAADAAIISYIPNNAYLVRVSAAGATALRQSPLTQTVVPWEPYYKLDLNLLPFAVQNLPMPDDLNLGVLVFPGEREAGAQALAGLGAEILGEDRSPFGHQLFVKAPPDSLPALARLSVVQAIEPQRRRQPANDLVRPRVGVADDSTNTANHLGLTGANVVVSVNDSGVDATHPDLQGRVFGLATADPGGHGTHVAGTIAGNGSMSSTLTKTPPGSGTNANYRGMAPAAKLFALPLDLIAGPVSDTYVQETVASSNIFVSNNSWGYVDAYGYDQSAASYDAATRDALPGIMGSQPLLLVFAAGNSGAGNFNGLGGVPGTIVSPAAAKNVITVGAFEQPRRITNEVIAVTGSGTNITRPFLGDTDSSNQVARFSSRGNVGIGIEGPSGRFKPDVVAPGTFVVSCRSDGWTDPTGGRGVQVERIQNQTIQYGQTNLYTIFVPANGVNLEIRTLPVPQAQVPLPDLPIYARADQPPDLAADLIGYRQVSFPVTPGNWYYAIGNTNPAPVRYNVLTILTVTNDTQAYYAELKKLNDDLKPWYRYESGTSQSAAAVSGIAALMQEMFEQRLGRTNSPALMKALLISGARSLGTPYSLQANNTLNYQGWGRVVLSNSLPAALAGGAGTIANWPVVFFDQDPVNALTTGESHTRTVTLPVAAQAHPLRVTLVWTDPPGNPAAGLKLVNDLDLLVTNRVTGEFYVGNNFPSGSDFTQATDLNDTNTVAPPFDAVNNVENVFINRPLSSSYDIIVRARRVNVNAVTANPQNIAQDYALVIASGNSRLSNATPLITVTPATASPPTFGYDASQFLKVLTANAPLLKERVGANSALLPLETAVVPPHPSNGASNQWNFYVFQHNDSVKTNVAILTFMPPNMSRPRYRDADIDLYVSTDPGLTNLDDSVVQQCAINVSSDYRSSRRRGGTEVVTFINPTIGTTYHIAVKSEDQQAAEFGILALETASSFGPDENGNYPLEFTPAAADVPDGSPEEPGGTNLIAVTVGMSSDAVIRRVVLTNTFTHQRAGDLLGNLSFQGQMYSVLNNHRSFEGTDTFVYDDSGENDIPGSQTSDGPGSLRNLVGQPIEGVWTFTMIDNALYHTGRVDRLVGLVEVETNSAAGSDPLVLTIAPLSWRFRSVNVPPGVTNLIVWTRWECPGGCGPPCPLEIYIRRGDFPDRVNYDKAGTNDAPGGTVTLGLGDNPPLQAGRYYIGTYNPNNCSLIYTQGVAFEWGLEPVETTTYVSTNTPAFLFDDALTNNIITVTNFRTVADVSVGVRLDHPRASDLVLHLTSPQGTRILLYENRGSTAATNLGFGDQTLTNITYAVFTERTNLGPPMKFAMPPYGVPSRTNRLIFANSFENTSGFPLENAWQTNYSQYALPPEFADTGEPGNKWTVLTNNAWIITDTNAWTIPPRDWVLPRTGSNVLSLNDARISHPLPTMPDHDYILRFAHRKVSSSPTQTMVVAVSSQADIFKYLNPTQVPAGTANSTDPLWVPKLRVGPGQEVAITVPTNAITFGPTIPGRYGPEGTNILFNGLPLYSLVGCWAYAPCDGLTTNTRATYPFYIGTNTTGTNPLMVVTAPTVPGDYYLFLGVNSDVFSRGQNLNAFSVTCRWQQCQTTVGDFVLSGVSGGVTNSFTNSFVSEFHWQTNEFLFRANPFTQELIFQPRINTTLLLDAVELLEPLGAYYLPEESMAPFQGEFAQGDWKLEIWDDRVGTSRTDMGRLVSWSLDFVFGEPLVVALTNGIWFCDSVRGDEVRYFIVQVPREVSAVTNQLLSPGGVELLYNPAVLPGTTFTDPLPPQFAPARFDLTTNTPPPGAELHPGQHYFLGVRNINPTESNDFCLRIDFNIPVIDLTNFGSYRIDIPAVPDRAAMWTNSYHAVTNMHYYRFLVTGAENDLITAVFQLGDTLLQNADPVTPGGCRAPPGDVNLVIRRVLPVVDHFPRPNFFDYESTLCGLNQEVIFVNSNSFPVKLRPGAYYLGVYNNQANDACYRVFAGFYTSAPLPYTIVDLALPPLNSTNVNFPSSVGQPLTTFYRYPSDPTAAAMAFQVGKAGGAPLDLIVRRADLPSPDLYEFSFLQDGAAREVFCLKTNNLPTATWWEGSTNRFIPNLTATNTLPFLNATNSTNWFIAVVNTNAAQASFNATLCVNIFLDQICRDCDDQVIDPPTPLPGVGFAMTWNTMPDELYVVEQSFDLKTWTAISTNVATSPTDAYVVTNSVHGPTRGFYRVRQLR